jgi:HK97 gp10 family phage protein
MITVKITGLDELIRGLAAGQKATPAEMRGAMELSLITVESDMRRLVPRDTGQLGNSITHGISGSNTDMVGVVGPTARYGAFVEFGTRPHWPPIAAISPWAYRHGIPPFIVARAIARHGTKPRPFVQPAWDRNRGRVTALFESIGVKIAAVITSGGRR